MRLSRKLAVFATTVIFAISPSVAVAAENMAPLPEQLASLRDEGLSAEKIDLAEAIAETDGAEPAKSEEPTKARVDQTTVSGQAHFGTLSVQPSSSRGNGMAFGPQVTDAPRTDGDYLIRGSDAVKVEENVGSLYRIIPESDRRDPTWKLTFPADVTAFLREDGGVGFGSFPEEGPATVSETFIAAPWAVDEQGNTIETSFILEDDGKTLRQQIKWDIAEGEIVADPRITFGNGVYVNFLGGELNVLRALPAGTVAAAVAGGCSNAGKIPNIALRAVVAGACAVGTTLSVNALFSTIWNSGQFDWGTCYQWKVGDYRLTPVENWGNCTWYI